jgi:hypothetical protein
MDGVPDTTENPANILYNSNSCSHRTGLDKSVAQQVSNIDWEVDLTNLREC